MRWPLEESLVIPVLARIATAGDEVALATLRDYIAEGEERNLTLWSLCDASGGLELVAGLDEGVLARFPTDDALAAALHEQQAHAAIAPWDSWIEHPRIARAFAPAPAKAPKLRGPRRKPLREMTTQELLAQSDRVNHRIVRQLVERGDIDTIIAAAREWNPLAVRAIGQLGRPELLELLEPPPDQPILVRNVVRHALRELPYELTRPLAHERLASDRRSAAEIFAEHAGPDDAPALRQALSIELALDAEADQYVICSLAQALTRANRPAPELLDAYSEPNYSFGRRFVVEAIAATDPAFDAMLAFECRFDCEPTIHEFVSQPRLGQRPAELAQSSVDRASTPVDE
jgi:hypothetical protein